MNPINNEVYALCQCDHYNFDALQKHFITNFAAKLIGNVVQLKWNDGDVFIFGYGVVVFWQVADEQSNTLLAALEGFAEQKLDMLLDDEFTFAAGTAQLSLKNDHIGLPTDDISTRLAISHGIAQSTELAQYEMRVQNTISSTEYIPNRIAETKYRKYKSHIFILQAVKYHPIISHLS